MQRMRQKNKLGVKMRLSVPWDRDPPRQPGKTENNYANQKQGGAYPERLILEPPTLIINYSLILRHNDS
jgi:hypothetical protein